jgi:hypothetical protein
MLHSTYFIFFLFPLALVTRGLEKISTSKKKNSHRLFVAPPLLNALLSSVVFFEARLAAWVRLPFGLSIICLAKKN